MNPDIKRIFLDWNSSCLKSTAEYIVSRYESRGVLDLRELTVALPSSRAGRRLLELLVICSETGKLRLIPPRIVTAGRLPELLYTPAVPATSDLERLFIWLEAIQSTDQSKLAELIPKLPDNSGSTCLLQLAAQIDALYVELSGSGLAFCDVSTCLRQFYSGQSEERWEVLSALHERYKQISHRCEVSDRYFERISALESGCCSFDGSIILVSVVDLNKIARQMLQQIRAEVTVLIHAPESREDDFDESGCLKVERWKDEILNIPDDCISIVDKPTDQASAVYKSISTLAQRHSEFSCDALSVDDITIGVTDDDLARVIGGVFAGFSVETRVGGGADLSDTSQFQLLRRFSEYIRHRDFKSFAALVRHPQIERYLELHLNGFQSDSLLSALDDYQYTTIPATLNLEKAVSPPDSSMIAVVAGAVDKLLMRFNNNESTLLAAAGVVRAFFLSLFEGCTLDRADSGDRRTLAINQLFVDFLDDCEEMRGAGAILLSTAELLDVMLFTLSQAAVPYEQQEGAIEILGWLELHLDDAPVLVVAGCNEGALPESVTADPFLPDSLRNRLELLDNNARLARDCYVLKAILASRPHVQFVAGRRSAEGDPLIPGRPLLSVATDSLPERVKKVFAEGESEDVLHLSPPIVQCSERSLLDRCKPALLEDPVSAIPVTAFRDYKSCPYRFYLKHVLRLKRRQDDLFEMDARRFGTFAHNVLYDFRLSEQRMSHDPEEVREILNVLLDERFAREFGGNSMPAVIVQREQLRYRLGKFAHWQARRSQEGWSIKEYEFSVTTREGLPRVLLGDTGIAVTARIDRIDYHPEYDCYQIFDYKTSEMGTDPDKIHRKNGEWIDFQLPAYRYILQQLGFQGELQPGYIVLPRDLGQTGELLADWTEGEYGEAFDEMTEIALAIKNQEFWPPSDDFLWQDDLSAVCDLARQYDDQTRGDEL